MILIEETKRYVLKLGEAEHYTIDYFLEWAARIIDHNDEFNSLPPNLRVLVILAVEEAARKQLIERLGEDPFDV